MEKFTGLISATTSDAAVDILIHTHESCFLHGGSAVHTSNGGEDTLQVKTAMSHMAMFQDAEIRELNPSPGSADQQLHDSGQMA